jgi:hypothetical protein
MSTKPVSEWPYEADEEVVALARTARLLEQILLESEKHAVRIFPPMPRCRPLPHPPRPHLGRLFTMHPPTTFPWGRPLHKIFENPDDAPRIPRSTPS